MFLTGLLVCAADSLLKSDVATPPTAKKVPVKTTLHGETLVDPYAWLRGKEKPEVIAHLEAENAYATAVMKPTEALQETLYNEFLGRIKQSDLTVPSPRRGWLYYSRTVEGQNYSILCRKKGDSGEEVVMLDANELAKGKPFFSVGQTSVSDDGHLLAYATDETGYRQYKLHVKDLRTGKTTMNIAERVTGFEWAADNKTFFFTQEDPVSKRTDRLYRQRLGEKTARLLRTEKDSLYNLFLSRSQDGQYIFWGSSSFDEDEIFALKATTPTAAARRIFGKEKGMRYSIEHNNGRFYVITDNGAQNFRLVSMPATSSGRKSWRTEIAGSATTKLSGMTMLKGHLVVSMMTNGLPGLRVMNLKTRKATQMTFPDAIYSVFASGNSEFDTTKLRYSYASPTSPSEVIEVDLVTGAKKTLKKTEVPGFDGSLYATERVWATAKDGTKVPIGLVYRKDKKTENMPTLLNGYGSYGASTFFSFNSNAVSLLDRGFIVAQAQIRGGSDMGEAWYEKGKMAHKMNTFTDFIACADYLVASKRSDRGRLVISGGSAGGLLIGAVCNLRPDVAKAAVLAVPFVDVINTMLDETIPLTTGEFLEWGNPKIKEQYRWMRAYSPYENIRSTNYPSMLVFTSLNDSQVGYHEPAKYVARMRELRTDSNPLVFRCYMTGGHGGASGRYDSLRQRAFEYSFVLASVGIGE